MIDELESRLEGDLTALCKVLGADVFDEDDKTIFRVKISEQNIRPIVYFLNDLIWEFGPQLFGIEYNPSPETRILLSSFSALKITLADDGKTASLWIIAKDHHPALFFRHTLRNIAAMDVVLNFAKDQIEIYFYHLSGETGYELALYITPIHDLRERVRCYKDNPEISEKLEEKSSRKEGG